jgi:phospholipase/lecithinase/hemolysin
LFCCLSQSATAAFSSIYIFGDSVSSTTTNGVTGANTNFYYGKRDSNGRTWVEVLAQRQGLGANSLTTNYWSYSTNNFSYWGDYSSLLVTNVNSFVKPANASNCLFVVWVCNADFVGDMTDTSIGAPNAPNNGTNLALWTAAINQHLTNHFKIITNLYFAKGMRTLVAPNAVNVPVIPYFSSDTDTNYKNFVRQRILSFNTNYVAMTNQLAVLCPALNIVMPDLFSVLDGALTNAAVYGLTNALAGGTTVDAFDAYTNYHTLSSLALNGPGTNYIFWDLAGPTAKMSEVFADTAQQMLSPPLLTSLTPVNNSNRIDAVNLPVGINGTILYATNLSQTTWLTNSTFSATNVTQSVFVSPTNSARFYTLKCPWQWSWP